MFKVIGLVNGKMFTFASSEDLRDLVPCVVHLRNNVYAHALDDIYIIRVEGDEAKGAENIVDFCDRNHIDLTRR